MTARQESGSYDFLAGGGEMGERMRALDWSKTPLGTPDTWPQSLRSPLSMLLPSKAQICFFWGPEFVVLYNDAYRTVFGAKHPQMLGMPGRIAWSEIWDTSANLHALLDGVVRTGEAFWAKDMLFFLERNGFAEETYFDVSYDPVRDESGGVGGVYCIVTETTGRVVGERRLALLKDLAARNATARTAREACLLAMETLAAGSQDVAFALAYLGDELQACTPHAEAALAASGSDGVHELAIPGGRLVLGLNPRLPFDELYRAFLRLVADQLGTAVANAQAYEAERKRAEALAAIDRAKTAFFSNVSHEFRTPLTLMLGPVEDALADTAAPLPAAQRERLELAQRSALRLQKLVNTLLDFSRIEASRAQASYEATDLAALTAELASSFRSAMEKAGLAFEVDCPPLAAPAWVDRDMWEKIVLNLLSNAFKFTFEGGISVSLKEVAGDFVFEIRDSGVGIPAAELPHVFERFRRVEGMKSRTHEGTGIGLALVQELVRLHGGTVDAQSVEGRGSTFRVTLPAGNAHLPAERIGAARTLAATSLRSESFVQEALRWLPHEQTSEAPSGGRQRIVWADDNADMREYVKSLLAPYYDVEAVADGAEALAAVKRRAPDLVLTDAMMPNVDGLDLVRRLRADPATSTVPVLVVSARAGEEARIEGLGAGADDYLYKPFSARELRARVAALLRSGELREENLRAEQALQESERRLQTLIANLPGMAYRCPTEPPWPLVFASEGVLGLTGYPARAFLAREVTWAELIHPDDLAAVDAEVGAALAQRRPFEMTYRIRYADGTLRCMLDRGRGIYAASGAPVAIEGFVLDLTRQHEAETALREADRMKDEFLATLAHELRNPLAPLRSALELLRRTQAPNEADAVRSIMQRQVDHLVRLVDDLLEVSRISRGVLELRRERVQVSAVVRNAVESSRPLIEAARHALEVALPEEPLWLDGDPVRLAQIVSNLLNNSAKYTQAGGRIQVLARREHGAVALEVRDNGEGIGADALPRLFEMFARERRTSERAPGGLGIGLALSRRLAELHGGSLEAESDGAGRGATFTLRVPLAAQPAASAEPSAGHAAAPVRARVLVVDDNRDAAETLGMLLGALGAEVRIAYDGHDALERLGDYDPDAVLLDIGMPGMDGYEVARAIRARSPRRPALIALTGWGQEEDRRRAQDAGFDHHLVKPAALDALQSLFASLPPQ